MKEYTKRVRKAITEIRSKGSRSPLVLSASCKKYRVKEDNIKKIMQFKAKDE
jgi:hypothetical protein